MAKRLIVGLFIAASLAVTVPIVLRATSEAECSPSVCGLWGPWHPWYWYFRCELPRCPDIITTLPPWEREGCRL